MIKFRILKNELPKNYELCYVLACNKPNRIKSHICNFNYSNKESYWKYKDDTKVLCNLNDKWCSVDEIASYIEQKAFEKMVDTFNNLNSFN